ncbi:MAG TPA: tetratricopeptide repeat protein [Vicinamibacterales bacterium]
MSRFNDASRQSLTIFLVALGVRLVHVWQLRASPFFAILMGDSRGYDEWAQRIAAGDWLGHDVFYQAPLYPYVLGVIYTIAGHHLLVVRVIQAGIGSASCVLLGLAAARLFGKRAGLVAGLILALYAPAIFFDGLIQKSVLDEFFVCLGLWLLSQTIDAESGKAGDKKALWLCLGLAMGGLALTRENALVFILVILGWIFFRELETDGPRLAARDARPGARSSRNQSAKARAAALFVAGLAIVLVPVALRNSYVGGGFYITTSQFGPNLYIGNHPGADGSYESLRPGRGAPEYERQDATDLAEHALHRRLTPGEVSSYWTDRAIGFMTSHPAEWLRLMGRKVLLIGNGTEMLDTESQESHAEWSWPLRLGAPFGNFGILIPLALFGLVMTWPMRSRLWVLYAMTAGYAASVVIFYVFARYRYPLTPFLIVFAAAGLVTLPSVIRARAVPGGWWTITAIAVAAVFANWPVLSADSMKAITESNLGVALQADQRVTEAIPHYQRAIALRPGYAPVYSNLASALRAGGHTDEAIATYQRALTLQPDFPDAEYNLANALLEAGKPDLAVEHFQTALRSLPGSVDVQTNLGIALANGGRLDPAIDAFKAALAIDPGAAKAHRNLADVLASAGHPDEAIDHLRQAVRLDPGDEAAHYDLGSLYLERQRLDEAVAEFRAALQLKPNAVEVRNNLGIALGSQGKLDEAIDQFQQALRLEPSNTEARTNLTMALQAKKAGR